MNETIVNESAARQVQVREEIGVVVKKYSLNTQLCYMCPIVSSCVHTKDKVELANREASAAAEAAFSEKSMMDSSPEGLLKAHDVKRDTLRVALKQKTQELLKDERCIFERQAIMDVLQSFSSGRYDITEPRTSLVLNQIIDNIIHSGRISKIFTDTGLLLSKRDPHGNVTFYANPLLEYKTKFSKIILDAIEMLDNMLKSDIKMEQDLDYTRHLIQQLRMEEAKVVVSQEANSVGKVIEKYQYGK
jgi:hypothetical protein